MSRKKRIQEILNAELHPTVLIVEDESSKHHVPEGSESHFKIVLVSSTFNNQSRIKRHRFINTLLATEFNTGLHALSLQLYTSAEWEKNAGVIKSSPTCRGGSRHD